jgi:pyruvate dehydrogenase complex dehydrogenase (E1) component
MVQVQVKVNKTHQLKKLDLASLKAFRDRFDMPFTDEELVKVPFYRPAENSPRIALYERAAKIRWVIYLFVMPIKRVSCARIGRI